MKYKKIIFLIIIFMMFCGSSFMIGYTYSRFITNFVQKGEAEIANTIANYNREGLFLKSKDGSENKLTLDHSNSQIIVNDIQPEDVISYYFSISNYNNNLENEVYLKVTITFSAYLRIKDENSANGFSTLYIDASKKYIDPMDLLVNSTINLKRDAKVSEHQNSVNGIDISYDASATSINYNLENLFIYNDGDKVIHSTGFYLLPYQVERMLKEFKLTIGVPGQVDEVDKYAGAQIILDINFKFEQEVI